MKHVTVLHTEAVDALNVSPQATIVDATLGSGGHAREILARLSDAGMLIALDADQTAIDAQADLVAQNVHLVHENFKNIDSALAVHNISSVDGILADLGWRTEQFDGGGKGFSFTTDEPLSMTFGDPAQYLFTAHDIVNTWDEQDVANVIKGYGEERFARRIASAIIESRNSAAIETSGQLADIVTAAVPGFYKRGKLHPATRTFQALRIAVNDELGALETFITKSIDLLAPEGRLAIITFHSLEDRIVKHTFRSYEQEGIAARVNKKPIVATEEERTNNPRSRSAKLRILQKHENVSSNNNA